MKAPTAVSAAKREIITISVAFFLIALPFRQEGVSFYKTSMGRVKSFIEKVAWVSVNSFHCPFVRRDAEGNHRGHGEILSALQEADKEAEAREAGNGLVGRG
jgi:hypothetical protein